MDPVGREEEEWCEVRREQVEAYLRAQGLQHGDIGEVPAWFRTPILSIWAVESMKEPGWVGWWVVCGDLPTDYCSAENCRHPRLALQRIAEHWKTEIGKTGMDDVEIGQTGLSVGLVPLLEGRAKLLLEVARDDNAWPE